MCVWVFFFSLYLFYVGFIELLRSMGWSLLLQIFLWPSPLSPLLWNSIYTLDVVPLVTEALCIFFILISFFTLFFSWDLFYYLSSSLPILSSIASNYSFHSKYILCQVLYVLVLEFALGLFL